MTDETTRSRWTLLGFGGAASLCCIGATGAAAGGAATGVVATATSGLVQVAVTALTLALVAGALRLRRGGDACER
ncbi:hypothetical protein [Halobacterium litoreum]|uniref:Lipoprotein n=1 Tax=Halobacterium litoreum TaxID=2039234 RepID=A0ABD5NDG1_9EURY|nr:hypothetical protein [Halobacterium litoreum]UHH14019.1 hypothetical protein LT972_03225 [Halobacterium litoreum]